MKFNLFSVALQPLRSHIAHHIDCHLLDPS